MKTFFKILKIIGYIFLAFFILIVIVSISESNKDSYGGGYSPSGEFCDYGYNPDTVSCCDEDDYSCEIRDSGATAQCNDFTFSFSQSRSGTCSYHEGVLRWIY